MIRFVLCDIKFLTKNTLFWYVYKKCFKYREEVYNAKVTNFDKRKWWVGWVLQKAETKGEKKIGEMWHKDYLTFYLKRSACKRCWSTSVLTSASKLIFLQTVIITIIIKVTIQYMLNIKVICGGNMGLMQHQLYFTDPLPNFTRTVVAYSIAIMAIEIVRQLMCICVLKYITLSLIKMQQ